MYDYAVARVDRIVDGDTIDLVVDLGFYLSARLRFRLLGVDTPERGAPLASASTAFVEAWCRAREGRLRVETRKADGFGRWLADLYTATEVTGDPRASREHLSVALIRAGLARPYVRGG